MAGNVGSGAAGEPPGSDPSTPAARGSALGWGPRLGIWAWSFVGVVAALMIVLSAVATVSEIVLPLTFAAVLAVCFKPMATSLQRHGLKGTAAAGLVVLGPLALAAVAGFATVQRVTQQTSEIADSVDAAIDTAVADLNADQILRDYGRGRTAMSAIVAVFIGALALLLGLPLIATIMVVNFIGGYIPYIEAFLGGGLAVIIALGEGGVDTAAIMLLAVVASNLLLENFVEPKVMGRTLDIHPLVVLVVTALGGILGGIVGLILAVPAWVVATTAISRLRTRGFFDRVTVQAQPTVRRMLE